MRCQCPVEESPVTPAFDLLGPAHLSVIVLTFIAALAFSKLARKKLHPAGSGTHWWEWVMIVGLAGTYPFKLIVMQYYPVADWEGRLPAHLCDFTALLAAGCLLMKPGKTKQRLAEVIYIWGLSGTLQGLLTPAVKADFPHPEFFRFFLLHAAVVVVSIYLVWGLNLRPEKGALLRVFGWLQVYMAGAAITNLITGSNYGFLSRPPPSPSLVDALGPWPWYILSIELIGLVYFTVLILISKIGQRAEKNGDSL